MSYILNSPDILVNEDENISSHIFLEDKEIKVKSIKKNSTVEFESESIDTFKIKTENDDSLIIDIFVMELLRSKYVKDIYLYKTEYTHRNTPIFSCSTSSYSSPKPISYKKLGKGGQGKVIGNSHIVEKTFMNITSMVKEISVYKYLSRCFLYGKNIPKLLSFDFERKSMYLEQYTTECLLTDRNVRKIISILAETSSLGVINSDIKPYNMLVSDSQLFVIDWGNSTIDRTRKQCQYRGVCGTRKYMCPEYLLMKSEEYKEIVKTPSKYVDKATSLLRNEGGSKIDVWSLGISILSQFFKSTKTKWENVDKAVISSYMKDETILSNLPSNSKELRKKYPYICLLLEKDMKKRKDIYELNRIVNFSDIDIKPFYGIKLYSVEDLKSAFYFFSLSRSNNLDVDGKKIEIPRVEDQTTPPVSLILDARTPNWKNLTELYRNDRFLCLQRVFKEFKKYTHKM